MARYTAAVCKICRREGEKLYLKGDRCYAQKCALERRAYPPGEQGQRRRKITDYALQLREKQKLRRMYGVLEKQFRLYCEKASRQRGVTGEILLQFLERRLDNVAYRAGFCPSRASAKPNESTRKWIKAVLETAAERPVPEWLSMDAENYRTKVLRFPRREEIAVTVNESAVIELYSK